MSVPAPERKDSTAEFIKVGKEILSEALKLYGRKYYEDIKDSLMQDIYQLASKMMECLDRGNDIYVPTSRDPDSILLIAIPLQQERIKQFTYAKGYLATLSERITALYMVRPVKHRYRGQKKKIGELLSTEYRLVKGLIESEEKKLLRLKKAADPSNGKKVPTGAKR